MIFSFWMLVTAAKLLAHCTEMYNSAAFKLYFLMIFSTVKRWWASMKQLNTVMWICNIETVSCKMIMTAVKIWSYCLSVVNCMTKNEENTVSIEVEFVSWLLMIELQRVIEFIHHCEWDRTLLRLATKHVKAYAQWVIVDI